MNQTSRKVEHSSSQVVIGAVEPELYGPVPSIFIADCLDVVEAADRDDFHSAISHHPNVLVRDPSGKRRSGSGSPAILMLWSP
jgi:hypothetical protein